MRFMMLIKTAENSGPPPKALMDAIGAAAEEAARRGNMVLTGGLSPTAASTRVRLAHNQVTATDGPFTETKEVIGGFAIFDFESKDEAVESAIAFMELHRRFWPGWEGETEVRQMYGPESCVPGPGGCG